MAKKGRIGVLERRKEKWGYFFILPWFIMFCIFSVYPLIYGIAVSFTDFNLAGKTFAGLENYRNLFSDYAVGRSFIGTLRYAVIVIPLQMLIPLFVASTLRDHSARVNTLVKLLIYMPGVTCSVALILVWNFMFAPRIGMIANLLKQFGLPAVSFFDNANISIPIVSLLVVFSNLGQNVVVFCAAINSIPRNYYEAAELDGASKLQQFINITAPMMYQTIIYVLVTNTIGALQIFVVPKLMTGGGPNFTSSTMLMLIYDTGRF